MSNSVSYRDSKILKKKLRFKKLMELNIINGKVFQFDIKQLGKGLVYPYSNSNIYSNRYS